MAANNTSISKYIVGLIAFVLVTIVYYTKRWSKLRQFKGPWLGAFSELWLANTALSGRFHSILMREQKKYGQSLKWAYRITLNVCRTVDANTTGRATDR